VLLLGVFVVSQMVQENAMFDLSLFRKPTFTGAGVVAFSVSASMFSMFLFLTLFMQTILGLSPLQTGLRFLPTTLVMFVVAAISGNLTARVPVRLLLSMGLALVGLGLLLMTGLNASSHWTALLAGFVVAGAGVGLINPPLASTAIGVVPPERSGMASGINSTFRQVGIATGIAALGAIFESRLASKLAPALAGTPVADKAHTIAHAVAAGGAQPVLARVPPGVRAAATRGIHGAFASALNDILLVAAVVALTGAALALALIRGRDFAVYAAPEPVQAATA
jgi:predicted MFS family arabinose efflux permease